jgi:predicted metal-dependent phosphotriesterase family hydrolase
MAATVMTVAGPVRPVDLGHVQPHEHVLIDTPTTISAGYGVLENENQMGRELIQYRSLGGGAVVDVTPMDLGRNPPGLQRISNASAVHIVMGTGWYHRLTYPPYIDATSTGQLTEILVNEIENGYEDTEIRPGIIGEIGSGSRYLSSAEERVFRAAARAQVRTGLPLMTHTPVLAAKAQLEVLREESVDPEHVVVGHCDNTLDLDYHEWILSTGAYIEFDLIGLEWINLDSLRSSHLAELLARGHEDRLLLSLDICTRDRLWTNGGAGYGYLIEGFLPQLEAVGFSQDSLHHLTHTNPQRLLGRG